MSLARSALIPAVPPWPVTITSASIPFLRRSPFSSATQSAAWRPLTELRPTRILSCAAARPVESSPISKDQPRSKRVRIAISFFLFTFSLLLFAALRQGLFEITLIDVFRRLRQRLFQNPLLRSDFDHRTHAFDVQVGVAVPDPALPIVIRSIAAMLDTDRHLF